MDDRKKSILGKVNEFGPLTERKLRGYGFSSNSLRRWLKELVRTVMASKSLKRRTKLLEQATQLLREIGQLKGRELGLKTIEEQIRKLARTG